jgi:hypothetical protein
VYSTLTLALIAAFNKHYLNKMHACLIRKCVAHCDNAKLTAKKTEAGGNTHFSDIVLMMRGKIREPTRRQTFLSRYRQ